MASPRGRQILLFACLLAPMAAGASPLFEDDDVLEAELKGPLTSVVRNARDRDEFQFDFTVDGVTTRIGVRVRGKSRVKLCRLPPLRLNFRDAASAPATLEGLDKVKLVTHCNWDKGRSESSVLNEYLAYRIFGLLADYGYRVRLLRIRYVDTDGKMKRLDRPYYGYLIEPTERLAERVGAQVLATAGVQYSRLAERETARLNAFQYLIGNSDWSLVTAEGEDYCCHNIDLIETGAEWHLVPYDFDLAGLVDANYKRGFNVNQTRRRVYGGYCRTPIEQMAVALRDIGEREDEILALARQLPAADEQAAQSRVEYLQAFFAADREELLQVFDKHCLGKR